MGIVHILESAHHFIDSQTEDFEDVQFESGQLKTKTLSHIGLLGRTREDINSTL